MLIANQEQEDAYAFLLSLQSEMLGQLKAGAIGREVYQHALQYVRDKKSALEKHFVKNIGHGARQLPSRSARKLTGPVYHRSGWSSVTPSTSCRLRVGVSCAPGWSSISFWGSLISNTTARST